MHDDAFSTRRTLKAAMSDQKEPPYLCLTCHAEIARLRAELAASMMKYRGHTSHVIDGVLTIVLHGGDTYQRIKQVIDDATTYGEVWAWVKVAPVPGSPAARIEAVSEPASEPTRDGMACFDDVEGAA